MVAQIKAEVGPINILVNNAGISNRILMCEMSRETVCAYAAAKGGL